jgi:mono/diheme cytochrome c family protein
MIRGMVLGVALALGVAGVVRAQDANVKKGMQSFTDQKCSVCHSIGDTGNKKGPLDDVGLKLSADEIRQWLTDSKAMTEKSGATRKPPMKEFKLSKGEVDGLVAYLQTLKKK